MGCGIQSCGSGLKRVAGMGKVVRARRPVSVSLGTRRRTGARGELRPRGAGGDCRRYGTSQSEETSGAKDNENEEGRHIVSLCDNSAFIRILRRLTVSDRLKCHALASRFSESTISPYGFSTTYQVHVALSQIKGWIGSCWGW